jgi:hypothetical protein
MGDPLFSSAGAPRVSARREDVLEFASEDSAPALRRLSAAGAFRASCAHVLSLAVIAERLGPRWHRRQESVCDHVERTLERHLGADGVFERISDVEYVIMQSADDRAAARGRSLAALREAQHYFLGAARRADLVFHEVSAITDEEVFGERIDVGMIESERWAQGRGATPSLTEPDLRAPFTAADGRLVRVACAMEPVYQLKSPQRIGYHVSRWVLELPLEQRLTHDEQRAFGRADRVRVDFSALSRALSALEAGPTPSREPSLILPASQTTLADLRARTQLLELFRQAQARVRHGLICEVHNIEGVPPSAVKMAAAPFRRFCRFLVGHVEGDPRLAMAPLREGGFDGVSVDFPYANAADTDFIGWMRGFMSTVRPVAKTVIIYGLDSLRHAAMANMMGATHASIRPQGPGPQELDVGPVEHWRTGGDDLTEREMKLWKMRDIAGDAG